jgi:Fe-S oxidoreductase
VDSITSYDDRMQEIGRATATILTRAGADFGILGKEEKDSGNESPPLRRGDALPDLKEMNTEAILEAASNRSSPPTPTPTTP